MPVLFWQISFPLESIYHPENSFLNDANMIIIVRKVYSNLLIDVFIAYLLIDSYP